MAVRFADSGNVNNANESTIIPVAYGKRYSANCCNMQQRGYQVDELLFLGYIIAMKHSVRIPGLIVLGCAVFLTFTSPAFAETDMSLFCFASVLVLGGIIIPVVIIMESIMISRLAEMKFWNALKASFWMNVASAAIGFLLLLEYSDIESFTLASRAIIPLTFALLILYTYLYRSYFLLIAGTVGIVLGIALIAIYPEGTVLFLSKILRAFSLTLAIEIWIARKYIPTDKVDSIVVIANMASYLFMTVVL